MSNDYRYSTEAEEHDLRIVWQCDKCQHEREDYPGYNEGGECQCGGQYIETGETYK